MASSWPPDVKARALDLYRTEGMAAAHAATGVPKGTIGGWARAAGARTPERADDKQTEAATRTRARQLDDARERRITLMATAAELALRGVVAQLQGPAADTTGLVASKLPLRDLVGVFTRAQHDLALATGEATENAAVAVTFTMPQASPNPPVVIPQDDLPALGA